MVCLFSYYSAFQVYSYPKPENLKSCQNHIFCYTGAHLTRSGRPEIVITAHTARPCCSCFLVKQFPTQKWGHVLASVCAPRGALQIVVFGLVQSPNYFSPCHLVLLQILDPHVLPQYLRVAPCGKWQRGTNSDIKSDRTQNRSIQDPCKMELGGMQCMWESCPSRPTPKPIGKSSTVGR